MNAVDAPRPSLVFPALAVGISAFLGLAIAGPSWIVIGALLAIAITLPVGLFAPWALVVGWIATGAPLSGWLDVEFGGLPAATVDRGILVVVTGIAAVQWALRPASVPRLGAVPWLMAGFLALAATTMVIRGGTFRTVADGGLKLDAKFLLLGYAVPFVGFMLGRQLVRHDHHVRWLLRAFVVVGCVVGAMGILQYFTGITIFTPKRIEVAREERASGPMTSAIEFGLVIGNALVVSLVLLFRSGTWPSRVLYAAAGLFIAVALVLSKTRATWLGFVVAAGVLAWYEPRLRRKVAVCAGVACVGLVAAAPFIAQTSFVQGRVLDPTPIYNRLALAATAGNMFIHNPIFGLGFGRYTFYVEKWKYLTSFKGVDPHYAYTLGVPHNEFLLILIMLGLAGIVPYLLIFGVSWRRTARFYLDHRDEPGPARDVALVAVGALTTYLVGGMFSDLMFDNHAANQVFLLLGVVDGLRARAMAGRTP